jgi:hypothetical protein
VYAICLKLDKVLFVMSKEKKVAYKKNMDDYEELKLYNETYEHRNKINATGYEK